MEDCLKTTSPVEQLETCSPENASRGAFPGNPGFSSGRGKPVPWDTFGWSL